MLPVPSLRSLCLIKTRQRKEGNGSQPPPSRTLDSPAPSPFSHHHPYHPLIFWSLCSLSMQRSEARSEKKEQNKGWCVGWPVFLSLSLQPCILSLISFLYVVMKENKNTGRKEPSTTHPPTSLFP